MVQVHLGPPNPHKPDFPSSWESRTKLPQLEHFFVRLIRVLSITVEHGEMVTFGVAS